MSAQRKRESQNAAPERVRVFLGDPQIAEERGRAALEDFLSVEGKELDTETVRLPDDPIEKVDEALRQVGMFSRGRCVLLRGPLDDADRAEALLKLLERGLPPESALVIVTPKLDGRGRLYRWLQSNATVEDYRIETKWDGRVADSDDLHAILSARIVANGFPAPATGVLEAVIARAGSDLGELVQEVDRLCLSIDPPRPLTREDVRSTVRDMGAAWIFDFFDALLERKTGEAQMILARLISEGEPPIRLLAVLSNRLGDFLIAAKLTNALRLPPSESAGAFARTVYRSLPDAARKHFTNPYRTYHVFRVARARGYRSLRALHRRLVQLDLDLKTGGGQPRHLLAEFVEFAGAARS